MPPNQTPQKASSLITFLVTFFALLGWYTYEHTSLGNVVKDFIQSEKSEAILASIKKEISNSGKLIRDGEFAKAHLTNSGVLLYTNTERSKEGLKPLQGDVSLNAVAEARMRDMFAKQYFEHVSPSGDSASLEADRIGYEYITLGENIALGNFLDDTVLVKAWMDSPGHRANILNSKFTVLGVAVGKGTYEGRQTWIAVQVFGKPLSECPSVDTGLKQAIDANSAQVDAFQATLESMKSELDAMEKNSRTSRDEYNQKVDAYNTLVQKTNALIATIKADVVRYNRTVQTFNLCLENPS